MSNGEATSPDVIIVGAGTAGSVIVRRLLDAGLRVTVLEAGGPDHTEAIHSPLGAVGLFGSEHDWAFQTEPQPGAAGHRILEPAGKTLGGSSATNGMLYVRGLAADYDNWAKHGATGWEWSLVEPYFRRLEDFDAGPDGGRGVDGPMRVQRHPHPDPLVRAFVDAAVEAGHPYNAAYNSGSSDGASFGETTIRHDGRRATAWVQYVRPVLGNPLLTVITGATVAEVVVSNGRAAGVRYFAGGDEHVLHADRVVLSAGVFGTPKVLMLSGLGPADQVSQLGLRVQVDLPGVGQNLQDHFAIPVIWGSEEPVPMPTLQGLESHVFARSHPDLATPDIQLILMSFPYPFIGGPLPEYGFTCHSHNLHPVSRGEVRLRSTDLGEAPLIDPRVYSESVDLDVAVQAVVLGREIGRQPALRPFANREVRPGPDVTDLDLRDFVRQTTVSGYHPVGTARMGTDPNAVVNPQLRVHGVEGLFVADASVMPLLPSGNTYGPSLMIGERAADFLLEQEAVTGRAFTAAMT